MTFVQSLVSIVNETGDLLKKMGSVGVIENNLIDHSGLGLEQIRQGLCNLRSRNLIFYAGNNKLAFTSAGKLWFNKNSLRYHEITHLPWDHKWRLVVFDIPQTLHRERDSLRQKLLTLKFTMLRRGVFVMPFPCESAVVTICNHLKISKFVDILTAEDLGQRTGELKIKYNL